MRSNPNTPREYRASLVVLFIDRFNCSRNDAADFFGIDLKTVYSDMQKIRFPENSPKRQWGGYNNRLLTYEEESDFLNAKMGMANDGLILTMPEAHTEYNKLVGRNTPPSTFYRMLERHGWRKILPNTHHPKGDPKVQEEFKKKPLRWQWVKQSSLM
jgi:hypothetical protein